MNDDVMIDCIPLSEIISIQANGETWKSDPGSAPPTSQNVSIPFPGANPGPTIAADSHEIFEIHTEPGGYNSGNTYYLQTTEQELADVLPKFKMNIEIAVRRTKQTTLRTCAHNIIKSIFTNYYFQLFIAVMIILVRYPPYPPLSPSPATSADPWLSVPSFSPSCTLPPSAPQNFVANIAEAQLVGSLQAEDGSPTQSQHVLDSLNLYFTAVFTLELCLNLVANWWRPFLNSWNLLDFVVVALSLAALGPIDLPMSVLRMMRVFRVIRLFGRMKELRKMIIACMSSLVPMANAFLIMVIIASICAQPPALYPRRALRSSPFLPPPLHPLPPPFPAPL
jgi:hypothetical protein